MKKLVILLFFLAASQSFAQSVTGKWYSMEDGRKKALIEVYKQGDKIYAKILKLLKEEDKGKVCEKCEGELHNKPIEGMVILNGLSKDGDEWSGGKIVDPKSGNVYKCYIELEEKDKLKVRGYIGFSLLGRTEYWYRAE